MDFWYQARNLYLHLYADGSLIPLLRRATLDFIAELRDILNRIVRFLWVFEKSIINQNLFLLDMQVVFTQECERAERAALDRARAVSTTLDGILYALTPLNDAKTASVAHKFWTMSLQLDHGDRHFLNDFALEFVSSVNASFTDFVHRNKYANFRSREKDFYNDVNKGVVVDKLFDFGWKEHLTHAMIRSNGNNTAVVTSATTDNHAASNSGNRTPVASVTPNAGSNVSSISAWFLSPAHANGASQQAASAAKYSCIPVCLREHILHCSPQDEEEEEPDDDDDATSTASDAHAMSETDEDLDAKQYDHEKDDDCSTAFAPPEPRSLGIGTRGHQSGSKQASPGGGGRVSRESSTQDFKGERRTSKTDMGNSTTRSKTAAGAVGDAATALGTSSSSPLDPYSDFQWMGHGYAAYATLSLFSEGTASRNDPITSNQDISMIASDHHCSSDVHAHRDASRVMPEFEENMFELIDQHIRSLPVAQQADGLVRYIRDVELAAESIMIQRLWRCHLQVRNAIRNYTVANKHSLDMLKHKVRNTLQNISLHMTRLRYTL